MALDWDRIIIIDDDTAVEGEEETVMIFASGIPGHSATIDEVTAVGLEPGSDPTVENYGNSENARFLFGIPKGEKGDPGSDWGGIGGDIENQTDLMDALNAKANTEDLGDLAGKDKVDWDTDIDDIPEAFPPAEHNHDDRYYTEEEIDTLISDYYTEDEVDEKLYEKLDAKDTTKSGSIVTWESENDYPLKGVSVAIDPVQDLHGYDAPWPAGGGKNLWDEDWMNGTFNENHELVSGSNVASKNPIPVSPSTTYYSKCPANILYEFYDSDMTWISELGVASNTTFSTPATASYMLFRTFSAYGSTYNHDIAINYPSTVTTYSPYSNVCPISGHSSATVTRTGINIWDEEWESGIWNQLGEKYEEPTSIRSKNLISVTPDTTYWLHCDRSIYVTGLIFRLFDINKEFISTLLPNNSFTIPSNVYYIALCTFGQDNITVYQNDISINYPSTDHDYHTSHVQSLSISLGDTRYGGTLNVLTGEMMVTHGIISDLSQLTWIQHGARTTAYYATSDTLNLKPYNNMISSVLKGVSATTTVGSMPDNSVRSDQSADNYIYVNSTIASNVPSFTASMSGVQLVYELAAPVTVTLTPAEVASLIGHNVLWCDTGNSTVVLRLTTGDLAYQDDIDYTSSQIKNKPTLGTMASKDDAASDTKAYGRKDGAWYDLDGRYYTESEVDDKLADKADIIHTSASGSLVHITDGAAYPVDSLTVGIEPVQDLHGYDNPWPAGGGKNLLDVTSMTQAKTNQGITATPNGDGTFALSGTAEQADINIWLLGHYDSQVTLFTLPAGTYTVTNVRLFNYHSGFGSVTPINGSAQYTFSEDQPITAVRVGQAVQGTNYTGTTLKPQIEKGSSATSWSPYSNICPISGHSNAVVTRTGKNLLKIPDFAYGTLNGVTFEALEDGGIWVHGTASANARKTGTINTPVYKDIAYTFGKWKTQQNINVNSFNAAILKSNNRYTKIASTNNLFDSFTAEEDGIYSSFAIFVASGTQVDNVFYPQLEVSSTATSYESPNIQTVTIDLDGTRYGGTLDVVAGTLTVDKGYISDMSQMSWSKMNSTGGWVFYTTFTGYPNPELPSSTSAVPSLICSAYNPLSASDLWRYTSGPGIGIDSGSSQLRLCDLNIADTTALTTALSGVQLVYKLATPTVITGLTPAQISLLLGENNVWADTGDVAVGYRASTKLYIDSKLASAVAELQALILENS